MLESQTELIGTTTYLKAGGVSNIGGWLCDQPVRIISRLENDRWIVELVNPIDGLVQPLAKMKSLPENQIIVFTENLACLSTVEQPGRID